MGWRGFGFVHHSNRVLRRAKPKYHGSQLLSIAVAREASCRGAHLAQLRQRAFSHWLAVNRRVLRRPRGGSDEHSGVDSHLGCAIEEGELGALSVRRAWVARRRRDRRRCDGGGRRD
jgi:hypothetical protein